MARRLSALSLRASLPHPARRPLPGTARRAGLGALVLAWALGAFPAACGGTPAPASPSAAEGAPRGDAAAPAEKGAPAEEPAHASGEVPTECTEKDGFCLPPAGFVKKLCGAFHPDVALAMFGKGSPWTRGYLKGDVEAWNASGGVSGGDKLVFDEEVLVLVRRVESGGGMQVSGAGTSYDVLRWDGSCATLSDGELTLKAPPKAKTAKLKWKDLGEAVQSKLLEDPGIAKINADRKKECKGVTMGDVSAKCVKAVDALSLAVVAYVRAGGEVPKPAKLP